MKKTIILLLMLMMAASLTTGCGQTDSGEAQTVTADAEDAVSFEDTESAPDEENAVTNEEQPADAQTEEASADDSEDGSDNTAPDNINAENDNETLEAEDTETTETEPPEFTVTALEEPKTMYATSSVNIRKGPSTEFERIGGLSRGQEVSVTGQADTGWYEILYSEDKAYVSDLYLQDDKPVEEPALEPTPEQAAQPQETPSQEAPAVQPVTEVKAVAGVILVGDSRFVQMQNNVGANSCTWIAESGKGYNWFNEKAVAQIDNVVGKGSKILINLGVNDPGNLQNYLTLVNAKAEEWVGKGATVYYASVNPVWENPYVTEEQVEYFNAQMQGGLSGNIHWIDSHSYLNTIGYKLVDGLHYSAETYQNLYAYYMSCL